MKREWLMVLLIGVLFAGSFCWGQGDAAQSKQTDTLAADLEEFEGKVLAISVKGSEKYGANLKNVRLKHLADRAFLVGTAVNTGHAEDWTNGETVWLAVTDIAMIYIMGNEDDLRRAR